MLLFYVSDNHQAGGDQVHASSCDKQAASMLSIVIYNTSIHHVNLSSVQKGRN